MKELLAAPKTGSDTPLLHFANQVCQGDLQGLSQQVHSFFKSVSDLLLSLSADNDNASLRSHPLHTLSST